MGYSAFQSNAFQNNAFQIANYGGSPVSAPVGGGGLWHSPKDRARLLKERIENLPETAKDAVLEAIQVSNEQERARALEARLKSVDGQFKAMYMTLMESYYQALVDVELARLAQATEKRRIDNDNLVIMLLLI